MLEAIIGLEIHIQLKTKSKMFCGCSNNPDAAPNTNICPICTGQPGVLPVANWQAIDFTVMTGLALNCKVSKTSKFDRKNYFYPDLPKGYQISQYDEPFCKGGYLEIEINGKIKKIELERIHLEEDAGKLLHSKSKDYSLVDLNRAGTPLMEIVTRPDIRSSKEAKIFLQELQKIVRYLNVSEVNMEKGQLRCDANVSLRPVGDWKLYSKTEIKNMNSHRAVERALAFEIKRQERLWQEKNPPQKQSTRLWDDVKQETREMRTKEETQDYRYFPEPDLPVFEIPERKIQELYQKLPELPQAKKERFKKQFDLSDSEVKIIVSDIYSADFFENAISELAEWVKSIKGNEEISDLKKNKLIKLAANWFISKLFALLNETKTEIKNCKITPENFAEFVAMLYEGKITSKAGQEVLAQMFKLSSDPLQVVEAKGLSQVSDKAELGKFIKEVISENPKPIFDFKAGKQNALQFLVGKVMQKTKGKANPKVVIGILQKLLQK
ncbi:MAG: Asp-tRNA(Asn)/Glu-tRNA(Gln) amidotransferase subunit GatB [Patescibacteria group bacterium]